MFTRAKKRKLANNTYVYRTANDEIRVRLHETEILVFRANGDFLVDVDGWWTVTTRDRINGFSPVNLWSEQGTWYISRDIRWPVTKKTHPPVFLFGGYAYFFADRRRAPIDISGYALKRRCVAERERREAKEKTKKQIRKNRILIRKLTQCGAFIEKNARFSASVFLPKVFQGLKRQAMQEARNDVDLETLRIIQELREGTAARDEHITRLQDRVDFLMRPTDDPVNGDGNRERVIQLR